MTVQFEKPCFAVPKIVKYSDATLQSSAWKILVLSLVIFTIGSRHKSIFGAHLKVYWVKSEQFLVERYFSSEDWVGTGRRDVHAAQTKFDATVRSGLRQRRTECAGDVNVVVHIPNQRPACYWVEDQVIWMSIQVKVCNRHNFHTP